MTEPAKPVLDQINLVVTDMAAAVDFYRRLGVQLDDVPGPWDGHHREAQAGEGVVLELDSQEFATTWDRGLAPERGSVVIGFRLPERDAVDRTYADLTAAGHVGQQEPYDAFWGARYAVVEDPDGNPVGLMSPIDPSRRAAPPTRPE